MKYFRAEDGAELAYRDDGEGIPVLALAGLTRDSRDFDYLEQHLDRVRLIRLDSRGRGQSQWTGAPTYTVADALALLDHLALSRVAVIGSSRGGLIGMSIAASARERLTGLCLNDVGPVLERSGLERIGRYLGVRPEGLTLAEVADRLPVANPGFDPASALGGGSGPSLHRIRAWRRSDIRPGASPEFRGGVGRSSRRPLAIVRRLRRSATRPDSWGELGCAECRDGAPDAGAAAGPALCRNPGTRAHTLPGRARSPGVHPFMAFRNRCRAHRARAGTAGCAGKIESRTDEPPA